MKITIKRPSLKIKISLRKYMMIRNICYFLYCKIKENIFLLIATAIMVLIFLFSNQPGVESSHLSNYAYSKFAFYPLSIIFKIIPIRKCAHIFLYFILSIFFYLHFNNKIKFPGTLSALCCYGYACLDEFHQMFIPGRSCMFTDTLFDLTGCLIGLILMIITIKISNLIKNSLKQ